RIVVAISQTHLDRGYASPRTDPLVGRVLKGLRRKFGSSQIAKTALTPGNVQQMIGATENTLLGCRDRALLLLGFATGLRRSELIALDVSDLTYVPDGLVVLVRHSKSDPSGSGRRIGVRRHDGSPESCPVQAIRGWLEQSAITGGPL